MTTGLYISRAVKHFVKMMIIVAGIYALMALTDTLAITNEELFGTKGIILIVALAVLSAAYPSYGFVTRATKGSITLHREAIFRALNHNSYTLVCESATEMVFRASGPLKKLNYMGDDTISVRQIDGEHLAISGPRKEVVQVAFRISGCMTE